MTDDQVTLLLRQKSLTPEIEQALRSVVAKRAEIASVASEIRVRDEETKKIGEDQERVRENLKALGNRAEERALVARYTRQLEEQETRLDVLEREIAEREAKRRALQAELDAMVRGLSFGK